MQIGLYFNSPETIEAPARDDTDLRPSALLSQFAIEAEALNYDCFLLAEPSMLTQENASQAYLCITELAEKTTKIKLGVADSVIALQDPIFIADQILSTANHLRERYIACISVGEFEEAFFENDIPFEQCRDRFEETLDVFAKRLRGGSFEHHGKHFQINFDATTDESNNVNPKFWITARDFPTLSSAAKRGYSVLPHILSEHRVVEEHCTAFAEMQNKRDHRSTEIDRPIVRDIFVAGTNLEAETRALDAYISAYRASAENCELIDFRNQPKFPETCSTNNILKHHLIIGDPSSVSEKLSELFAETQCNQIIARMCMPNIKAEHVLESMALFANEVQPELLGSALS